MVSEADAREQIGGKDTYLPGDGATSDPIDGREVDT